MKRFKTLLSEAKLTHLEHIEDAILDDGYQGGVEALKMLKQIRDVLTGHSNKAVDIQVKVDGAPAVVCGTCPETGKFFVGTKSIFNRNPKVNYTKADIDANHGNSEGLSNKLKAALDHLPKIWKKGLILQGDFMFTPDDLKDVTIDDVDYTTFTPNTITYAIPKNSPLDKTIQKAKVGIIFHTTYSGDTLADLSANFKVNIKQLKQNASVWFTDTYYQDVSGKATLTSDEDDDIMSRLRDASSELKKLDKNSLKALFGNDETTLLVKTWMNSRVREGLKFRGRQQAVASFIDWLRARGQAQASKLKTDKGKQKKLDAIEDMIKELRQGKSAGTFAYTIEWHNNVQEVKDMLVKKMEQVNKIDAFLKTATGYKVTGPEGFVAVDKLSNKAVKLVDRMEFSRANFNAVKSWG